MVGKIGKFLLLIVFCVSFLFFACSSEKKQAIENQNKIVQNEEKKEIEKCHDVDVLRTVKRLLARVICKRWVCSEEALIGIKVEGVAEEWYDSDKNIRGCSGYATVVYDPSENSPATYLARIGFRYNIRSMINPQENQEETFVNINVDQNWDVRSDDFARWAFFTFCKEGLVHRGNEIEFVVE